MALELIIPDALVNWLPFFKGGGAGTLAIYGLRWLRDWQSNRLDEEAKRQQLQQQAALNEQGKLLFGHLSAECKALRERVAELEEESRGYREAHEHDVESVGIYQVQLNEFKRRGIDAETIATLLAEKAGEVRPTFAPWPALPQPQLPLAMPGL